MPYRLLITALLLVFLGTFPSVGVSAQAQPQSAASDTTGVYRQGPGVVMPKVRHSVEASFTDQARARSVSGVARVQIIVDVDGHIRSPQIVKSIADSYSDAEDRKAALSLDQSALEVVTHYVFEPGTFNGRTVPVFVTIEISFQLAPNGETKDSDSQIIYSRGPGVVMPKLLQAFEPSFTEAARKRKIGGQATVQFIVDANGRVRNARIIKSIADGFSSPEDRAAAQSLDQKAIDAVYHYAFAPGTFHDQPASVTSTAEISFQIH
jgi:TonB family protein